MSLSRLVRRIAERHGVSTTPAFEAELAAALDPSAPTVGPTVTAGADLPHRSADLTWAADGAAVEWEDEETESRGPALMDRYERLGVLGKGGMGEVLRVRDHLLNRIVAMKQLAAESSPTKLSRFLQEAQATAQLEHPGIVPIYDYGVMSDGRVYYTMQVIQGTTLGDRISAVHRVSDDAWRTTRDGFGFRRMMAAFLAVCEAIAFAHDRGVLHRDLKPANIMLGPYGTTLVVDWGLAKVLGNTDAQDVEASFEVHTSRSDSGAFSTSVGTITGTPHYMPPEQARGEIATATPASDVWSLGAILYEILTGRPPFKGSTSMEVLAYVMVGDPDPPVEIVPRPVPVELSDLALSCLEKRPEDRPKDAGVLVEEVRAWLDGARRREQALELVTRADAMLERVGTLRTEADTQVQEARGILGATQPWSPPAEKAPGWEAEDRAQQLRYEARQVEIDALALLRQAENLVPDLAEPHSRLAAYYQRAHAAAEASRDSLRAAEYEKALRQHDRGEHAEWLSGVGAVSLPSAPHGARVEAYRVVERGRRLVLEHDRPLGATPIERAELPIGSWVLHLAHDGCAETVYPIHLGRLDHWSAEEPVRLLREGRLASDERLIPAGWFLFAGDPDAHAAPPEPRRVWVGDFICKVHPVTNAEWAEFLTALTDEHGLDRAREWAPVVGGPPAYLYDDHRWRPDRDEQGHPWLPRMPVVGIPVPAMLAFSAWKRQTTGLPWRLPYEVEWEKAARGVDGRLHPWGDFFDPTWTIVRSSRPPDQLGPAVVDDLTHDVSCYGIQGMNGNVAQVCLDDYRLGSATDGTRHDPATAPVPDAAHEQHTAKGGHWNGSGKTARACTRYRISDSRVDYDIGLRLVRPVVPEDSF